VQRSWKRRRDSRPRQKDGVEEEGEDRKEVEMVKRTEERMGEVMVEVEEDEERWVWRRSA